MSDELINNIEAIIDSCALFRRSAEAKAIGVLLVDLRRAQQGEPVASTTTHHDGISEVITTRYKLCTCDRAAIKEAAPADAPRWIDLKDEKPRDWQPVLVALSSGEVVEGVRASAGWHWSETDAPEDAEATATHWMAWPEHPSATSRAPVEDAREQPQGEAKGA